MIIALMRGVIGDQPVIRQQFSESLSAGAALRDNG